MSHEDKKATGSRKIPPNQLLCLFSIKNSGSTPKSSLDGTFDSFLLSQEHILVMT